MPVAFDSRLDHHVDRSARHDQMLDIVAADEDELAVPIDGCAFDDAEPPFATFEETRPAPSRQHEGLEGPGDEGDHREREQEGGEREKEAVGVGHRGHLGVPRRPCRTPCASGRDLVSGP